MSGSLLQGRRVVITAAAGTGIGFATAKRCLEEGATVVISDRHERRLSEAAERLGAGAQAVVCDVTVEAQVAAMLDGAGEFDVLVCNAGLGGTVDLVDMADEQWDRILDVTLTGTMRCIRGALRRLRDAGRSGVIVTNASVLGWRAQAGQGAYAAAKAGVMALTRAAAMEGAPHGIRVNGVAPSLAMHAHLEKSAPAGLLEELAGREAFGRAATPEEIANVILFLASDLSSYMTGEIVSVSSQHA
jgi:3-oxoacyl-[acyl-carrier protein] reductase